MEFYNRDNERNTIKEAFDVFEHGGSVAIWIEGRRGLGKTYLLNHMAHIFEDHLFRYSNGAILYKCSKNRRENAFDFILSILTVLQLQNADEFNKIIVDYFNSISSITVKECLIGILPCIPGLEVTEKVFDKFGSNITGPQNTIQSKMLDNHLIICFSDILKALIRNGHYMFCVDDIVWIDEKSKEVLSLLMNSKDTFASFFITTRQLDDLDEDWERQSYNMIHDELFEYRYNANNFFEIQMYEFKLKTVEEILADSHKKMLLDNIDVFYDMTCGSPLEIMNSLKYSDDKIVKKLNLYKRESESNYNGEMRNYLSVEFVSECMDKSRYHQAILAILAIVDIEISQALLFDICTEIINSTGEFAFENYMFESSLSDLITLQEINQNKGYQLKNDSDNEIIKNNLVISDYYYDYIETIADVLYKNASENELYYSILLKICCVLPTKTGFEYFKKMCLGEKELTSSIVLYASQCFQQSFDNITNENINKYVVPFVLIKLINCGELEESYSLCSFLYKSREFMNLQSLYTFYLSFVKVLVDLGKFRDVDDYSANRIYGELCKLDTGNPSNELEIALIGMTVYEHQNRFEDIAKCFNHAQSIVQEKHVELNASVLSKFYRNHGLIYFHSNLKDEYFESIGFAKKAKDFPEQKILYGTAINNLGLSYFYSEEIHDAIKCFVTAKEILFDAGYEIVRPLNNIACCHIMLGDIQTGQSYINKALEYPFCGTFERSSAQLNQALALIKLNDIKSAIKILDCFIDEYKTSATKDGWIYSNAFLLRGYANYVLGNNIEASNDYKHSKFYVSRFENEREQLRRDAMLKHCLYLESIIPEDGASGIIDLNNDTFSFYKKPFILCLLAYYVI